jgi:hypothetical protein
LHSIFNGLANDFADIPFFLLDYPARRLYWTDMKARSIESVRLDGKERQTILHLEPKLGKPFRIEVFEDTLFFTTYRINKILRVNKFGAGNVSEVAEEVLAVTDLTIMQEQKHDDRHTAHPCRNSPCRKLGPEALCVAVPWEGGALTSRCLCARHTVLTKGKCVREGTLLPPSTGNPCDRMNCHQGSCVVVNGAPSCRCNPFYVGDYCESYICADYCLNGGHCIPLDPGQNETAPAAAIVVPSGTGQADKKPAVCVCKLGYYGDRCELDCAGYCRNNATCRPSAANGRQLECSCRPPFTGPRCDECPGLACGAGYCTTAWSAAAAGGDVTPMCRCPSSSTLSASCEEEEKKKLPGCLGFDCHHNGTCRLDPVSGQPECVCTDSMYSGRQCEWDKCRTVYCRNGGFGRRDSGRCVCACRKGFTGDKCENRLSDYINCDGVGCENGGLCKTLNGRKVCACPVEYTGPSCSIRLVGDQSPCRQILCENGGICQAVLLDRAAGPKYGGQCICDNKYGGEYCQYANKCYKHCLNGGTCVSGGPGSVVCHCPPGWKGGRCQLNFGSEGRVP